MLFKMILPAIIILSLSAIHFSCDILTSSESTVNGKVYNYQHQPISNIKVTAGGQSVFTSEDGSFTINSLTFPYDIVVTDSNRRIATVFKGISTGNITLPIDDQFNSNFDSKIRVKIPLSIIQSGSLGKILFTDGNYLNYNSDITTYDTGAVIRIYNSKPVTGKLIVLTFKKDNNGRITSYENYGESSEIQILPGITNRYQFDSLDLTLNPSEQTVTGSFEKPEGYDAVTSNFSLSFSPKKTYFSNGAFTGIGSFIFNFLIPGGIPSGFNTLVNNYSNGGELGSSSGDFIVYPNTANRPEVKLAPAVISPEDHSTTVNNSTEFTYSAGTGDGIYIVSFHNFFRDVRYKIVTSKTSVTMEGLEDLGFGYINNNDFYWSVSKTGPANSMNDYASGFFEHPTHFSSTSVIFNFTTSP